MGGVLRQLCSELLVTLGRHKAGCLFIVSVFRLKGQLAAFLD